MSHYILQNGMIVAAVNALTPNAVWLAEDDSRVIAWRNPVPSREDSIKALKAKRDVESAVMNYTPPGESEPVQVQTDHMSRINISGAVQLALLDENFSDDWTLLDNTKLAVDQSGMIALGVATGLHIKACHDRYDTLRAAITAAETDADAAAIDITTGWP